MNKELLVLLDENNLVVDFMPFAHLTKCNFLDTDEFEALSDSDKKKLHIRLSTLDLTNIEDVNNFLQEFAEANSLSAYTLV